MNPPPLVAGIELGGTKCICLLATGPGDIRDRVRIPTTDPETTLGAIGTVLRGWSGYAAIGVASFGPIGIDRVASDYGVVGATTKRGWAGTDIGGRLAKVAAVPLGLNTDVAGAGLAEARWGAATGLEDLAYVTIGTGVGVGMILGGQPLGGRAHGELGHVLPRRVTGDDWPGICSFHQDCVEGLASGAAILARTGRRAAELAADDPAWTAIVDAITALLCMLVLTGVPRRIVIGGGVIGAAPYLIDRLRTALGAELAGYVDPSAPDEAFVVAAALGDDAGPLGAILLGQRALSALQSGDAFTAP